MNLGAAAATSLNDSSDTMLERLRVHFEVQNDRQVFCRAYRWYHNNPDETAPEGYYVKFQEGELSLQEITFVLRAYEVLVCGMP